MTHHRIAHGNPRFGRIDATDLYRLDRDSESGGDTIGLMGGGVPLPLMMMLTKRKVTWKKRPYGGEHTPTKGTQNDCNSYYRRESHRVDTPQSTIHNRSMANSYSYYKDFSPRSLSNASSVGSCPVLSCVVCMSSQQLGHKSLWKIRWVRSPLAPFDMRHANQACIMIPYFYSYSYCRLRACFLPRSPCSLGRIRFCALILYFDKNKIFSSFQKNLFIFSQ